MLAAAGVRTMSDVCVLPDVKSKLPGGLLDDLVAGATDAAIAALLHGGSERTGVKLTKTDCVLLEGVNSATIEGVVQLAQDSACPVVITRGVNSKSPANVEFSYAAGFRLDVMRNDCLDAYISTHLNHRADPRSKDGALIYENEEGDMFFKKSAEWELLFF